MIDRREFTALLAGGIAGLAASRRARAAPRQSITVRLDWVAGADHGALFLAKARGYYDAAGLDVQLLIGKGSVASLQAITSGNDTIGIANLSTLALAVGAGAPLTAVACILQRAPDGLIALAGSGITKPKDLEGKRFGFIPQDSGERMFPAFARATGINTSLIKFIQLNHSAAYTSLLTGNIDVISGWSIADALKVGRIRPVAPPIIFANYGVNTLGNGLFVTRNTLSTRGDMLKAFLAATVKGAADAQQDPKAAVDAILAEQPSTNREIALQEASMLKDYLHTANTQGHGFGWMSDQDWRNTVKLLGDCCKLDPAIDVGSLYTNTLLPSA